MYIYSKDFPIILFVLIRFAEDYYSCRSIFNITMVGSRKTPGSPIAEVFDDDDDDDTVDT